MSNFVFVYGTLKDGLSNNVLLRSATFVSRGCTVKPYIMYDTGGFPVVFQETEKHNVSGEVYEVDDQTLQRLDRLEGHPSFFERREITVDLADTGVQHTCWMYFGHKDGWGKRAHQSLPEVSPQDNGAYNWRAE